MCGVWGPDADGVSIADDLLAVVSPQLYAEFGTPYNNRLSDALGGLMIHSCGDVAMNLQNILDHHNLKAVNFQVSENKDYQALAMALGPDLLFLPTLGLNSDRGFLTSAEYVRQVTSHMKPDSRVMLMLGVATPGSGLDDDLARNEDQRTVSVSYTHLTLPTN